MKTHRDAHALPAGDSGWALFRRAAIIALAASLFFGLYQHHRFRGLREPAAMEYAQLARALAEGRGYTTRMMRPAAFGAAARRQPGRPLRGDLPELERPPLYPAILAGLFRLMRPDFAVPARGRVFAPEIRVIIPLGWVAALITALLLFLVADRFFDRRIAGLAPPVYLFGRSVLQGSISGLPDPTAALLGTAALAVILLGAAGPANPASGIPGNGARAGCAALTAGILAGAAALCDYSMIWFAPAPAIAAALMPARRRGLMPGLFAAGLLAAVTPWYLRNLAVGGHPFGLAHLGLLRGTAAFPDDRFDRSLTVNPDALRIGALLARKWLEGISRAGWASRWCAGGEALFPALALPALLLPRAQPGVRRLRAPLLGAAIPLLVLDPLLSPQAPGRLLQPLLPWMILLGCAVLIGRLDEAGITWPLARQAVCALALGLHLTPTAADLLRPREPLPYPPVYPPFTAAVCALVEDEELMVSDIPWATAWYGNQRTLWLPNNMAEFHAVNDFHQTVAALYLTARTGGRPYIGDLADGRHRDWLPLFEGRLPDGFPLTEGLWLPPGRRDQLLLTGPGRFASGLPAE